ncbi:MAG: DinB family protein [Dehalococcoidia bacterium]
MQGNPENQETVSDETRQQVVGYLRHQASKSTADLLGLVDRSEGWIDRSLEGVSESQAQFCPEPGEWCIAEVLRHVDASMRGTARLVTALAAGENVSAKMANPPVDTAPKTLAELRRGVARSFDELRAAVTAIPDGADSKATANHPFFGDLTCKEWAAFVYVHARDHADQIEKVKADPAFPR